MRFAVKFALALLCVIATVSPAAAATLILSYHFTLTNKTVTMNLSGDLGADGNTFVVTGFDSYAVDGTPAAGIGPSFDSADDAYFATQTKQPTVTLDGSFLDFAIYNGLTPHFVLGVGDDLAGAYQSLTGFAGGAAGARPEFGGDGFENYDRANYSAALVASPVPEPATWLSLVLGFGVMGAALRRKPTTFIAAI